MKEREPDRMRDGALLSAALKAVRRLRGMTVTETASRMNMPKRTYERFEAGETRFNIDYLHRFARATASDPFAPLLAVAIGSPEFAARCADNQFGAVLMGALRGLDRQAGSLLPLLSARDIIDAATALQTQFIEDARATAAQLRATRDELDRARPRPGR